MQREIKFRAWDKKENKWLFGYDLPSLGGFSMFGEIMLMGEWTALLSSRFPNDTETIEVSQFTGLKDKNDKEIYEGDVLKIDDGCEYFSPEERWEVYWECDSAGFWVRNLTPDEDSEDWTEMSPWSADIEIIGNIYSGLEPKYENHDMIEE